MRRGHPEEALDYYRRSLERDPRLTRNYLSLTAALLELGRWDEACVQLSQYVKTHPRELDIRAQHAELLLRLHRGREAHAAYERCVAEAQQQGGEAGTAHLIRCHSRLMEMAEGRDDPYEEHLHRGIGLYLLGKETADLPEAEAELPSESLYCKAAGELTLARQERPAEARPCWYLYSVWSRLAQRQPAQRCLREAAEAAPFTYLTPVEQRGLHMAAGGSSAPAAGK
jgi:tetratricopeptide (TPR) repeat protein